MNRAHVQFSVVKDGTGRHQSIATSMLYIFPREEVVSGPFPCYEDAETETCRLNVAFEVMGS